MTNKPSRQTQVTQVEAHHQYNGPIPEAREMASYEAINPGFADRILKMAENQAAHRQEIEKVTIKANARNSTMGVVVGGIIGMTGIICGTVIILSGYEASGLVAIIGQLVGLAGVFVYGKWSNKKELIEKQKLIAMYKQKQ